MRRAVVSYEDLPHDAAAVQHAATEAVAEAGVKKRRKTNEGGEKRYHGPHWDEQGPTSSKAAPAWSQLEADDILDSDDAVVASPTMDDSPFLESVEVPSGAALMSRDVWDDQFLLDAWNAAEEEYAAFHRRRSDALDEEEEEEKEGLWYSLPTEDEQARGTWEDEEDDDEYDNGDHDDSDNDTYTPGWKAAQRIVAATPNSIGASSSTPAPSAVPPAPSLALPAGVAASDTLQSLVMAWYYTGYYTALYQREQEASSLS
ncbi:uncharacterized protein MJAP1_002714 [Malassezia japonica]|uniref:Survival motor neuron Tudor domain-containing protein n=1 Tax=Malassezia japonica TaxID=223818 RepID=A0AAF0JAR7_9BASI|nr:uncharacterized protein MJAP1_002714 [Malassezia japonica]WFD39733.1 hypothetical protein MJAP1_002714 [Malassezia japonica]